MRHQNQSKHGTSISSIDKVLPSRRDHLKKWSEFDSFTHHSLMKDTCCIVIMAQHYVCLNWMHEWLWHCSTILQSSQVVCCSLVALFSHELVCFYVSTHKIIQDCIILVLFSYKTQTALNRQPYGELSMPALNNRLSAILLKLNPAQIPHQKH